MTLVWEVPHLRGNRAAAKGLFTMSPKKFFLSVAAVSAFAGGIASSPAAAATVVNVGTMPSAGGAPYFYLTSGTPTSPSITANFGATISGMSTSFDDLFEFTIPQNGIGSGSLSTSFSALTNELNISQVLIDGVSHALDNSSGGQSLTVNDIPILSNALNTIEVIGSTSTGDLGATYTGTATFAAAVPEPATWVMTIFGLGFIGATLRRRRAARLAAASFA
jgi:hypothetical protein